MAFSECARPLLQVVSKYDSPFHHTLDSFRFRDVREQIPANGHEIGEPAFFYDSGIRQRFARVKRRLQ
jgi:hypothetical protein